MSQKVNCTFGLDIDFIKPVDALAARTRRTKASLWREAIEDLLMKHGQPFSMPKQDNQDDILSAGFQPAPAVPLEPRPIPVPISGPVPTPGAPPTQLGPTPVFTPPPPPTSVPPAYVAGTNGPAAGGR